MNAKRISGLVLLLFAVLMLICTFSGRILAQGESTFEANKQIVNRYLEVIWSRGYHPVIRGLVTQGDKINAIKEYRELFGIPLKESKEAIENLMVDSDLLNQFRAANYASFYDTSDMIDLLHELIPNLEMTIEDIVGDGEVVAVRMALVGRHTGKIATISPSNNEVEVTLSSFLHLREGKITEEWLIVNTMDLFRQIGVTGEMVDELLQSQQR